VPVDLAQVIGELVQQGDPAQVVRAFHPAPGGEGDPAAAAQSVLSGLRAGL
jgi:hypothetical protein